MKESGVLDKVALCYGQMNEPPGAEIESPLQVLRWLNILEMRWV